MQLTGTPSPDEERPSLPGRRVTPVPTPGVRGRGRDGEGGHLPFRVFCRACGRSYFLVGVALSLPMLQMEGNTLPWNAREAAEEEGGRRERGGRGGLTVTTKHRP